MRRSACPSQLKNPSKRSKFTCPLKTDSSFKAVPEPQIKPAPSNYKPVEKKEALPAIATEMQGGGRSTLDVLRLLQNVQENIGVQCETNDVTAEGHCEHFGLGTTVSSVERRRAHCEPAGISKQTSSLKPALSNPVAKDRDGTGGGSSYFRTVWCKTSSRKHKKWEGDAILIVGKQSAVLKDMSRKEIGRALGLRAKQLKELEEGSRLVVGGKEVEILEVLSSSVYESGSCFENCDSGTQPDDSQIRTAEVKENNRAFIPVVGGGHKFSLSRRYLDVPRFDPTAPGALVMPRPPPAPATAEETAPPLIDVVVDPVLCRHLRPHQRDGVVFLYECVMGLRGIPGGGQGAILADDMGVGKTLQCIALVWTLLKQGPYGGLPVLRRVLVVTPSSLTKTWQKEFQLWLGKERLATCLGDATPKVELYCKIQNQPVLITSYELLTRNYEALSAVNFDLVICDEGHKLKNANCKTSSMLAGMTIRRRVVLTGTPVQNDMGELFALADFCNPGALGTPAAFRRQYEEPILRSRQSAPSPKELRLGEERNAELGRIIGRFVLRRSQDVNSRYLPPKQEHVVFCWPTGLQVALYRRMLESVRSYYFVDVENEGNRQSHRRDGGYHLRCIVNLKKLCNHPALIHQEALNAALSPPRDFYAATTSDDSDGSLPPSMFAGLAELFPADFVDGAFATELSGKLRVLDKLLETFHSTAESDGPREKAVVVSAYTRTMDMLAVLCRKRGYGFARLDGSTPPASRQDLLDRFNSEHCRDTVFLLSLKAGGVGLNLSSASRIVLFDVDWNPANDLQAMSRVWRDGQRWRTHIYRLVTTGTIEERMYQRQMVKHGISRSVIDAKDNNKMHFSAEELKDLFSLDESTECTTHDLLECSCSVDGRNVGLSSSADSDDEKLGSRACQLGVPKPCETKSKALSMDELLSWDHVGGKNIDERYEDSHLTRAKNFVSFMFSSSSKSSK